ncbi:hypothetical protein A2160_05845 [Candidatus Beckwithbacteria bacterium RBG_13_42_9]|uniref:Bacterial Ig-like domain-containing protein n=1 Tax=Candidatus Beckwithbacteria bacterium RBG_13_42_9 TaxID=1797457 RepID=A0A1F5E5F7_9BACT|nr:MAG: hypothetical protein A2160_05845 [Candidatus Beckwithbacteria bacterium RBG_13_42_9]
MPKEITFAILIGFVFGLLITFGLYTANKAIKEQGKQTKAENTVIPSPTTTTTENVLTLSEPKDEELFSDPEITLSGKTNPNAVVAVLLENGELFTEADADGFFSQKITLAAGVNSVSLVSTNAFGNQAQIDLTLTYSTKLKEAAPSPTE